MYLLKLPFYFLNVFIHMAFFLTCVALPFKKDFRFSKKVTVFALIMLVLAFCLIDVLFFEVGSPLNRLKQFVATPTLIVLILYAFLLIKKHYFHLGVIVTAYFTFHITLSLIVGVFEKYFSFAPLISTFAEMNNLILQQCVLFLFAYPMWILSAKLFSKAKEGEIDFLQWKFTAFLPLLLFALCLTYYSFVYKRLGNGMAEILLILLILAIEYFTYFTIMKIIILSEKAKKSEENAVITAKQIEFQIEKTSKLEEFVSMTSRERHDFRHHVRVIKALVDSKDVLSAQKYLDEYEKEHSFEDKSICENKMIDGIMMHFVSRARTLGAEISTEVNVPSSIGENVSEICACIGNILENATEAIDRQKNGIKFLKIKADMVGEQMILVVSNSFEREIQTIENGFVSSKEKRRLGVGIDSVKKIVERRGGSFEIQHGEGEFKVSAVINIIKT